MSWLATQLGAMSLRQRFLVAPALGLVFLGLLTTAFVYETREHSAVLARLVAGNLVAIERHSAMFVHLSGQHLALYDLLNNAAVSDEDALYEGTKQHLHAIHDAVRELETGLPALAAQYQGDAAALERLVAEVRARTRAYREAVVSAVELTTLDAHLGPFRFAQANERFVAMNRAFAGLLDWQRLELAKAIRARDEHSRSDTMMFSLAGVVLALGLIVLSVFLSRVLSRALEGQIRTLGRLGGRSGIETDAGTGHEIERIGYAIATFRHTQDELRRSEERYRRLVERSPDAIFTQDEGHVAFVNRACLELLGATHTAQLVGRPAIDFVHPDQRALVLAQQKRVDTTGRQSPLFEMKMVKLDGSVVDVEATSRPFAHGDRSGSQFVLRDITERKRAQEYIAYLSQYDVLTALPNRNLFRDRLNLALARAKRRGETTGVLLFNIDRFKQVNEGLGVDAGDDLLRQIAGRLKDTLREVDTIARLGSDEFAILVEGAADTDDVRRVADNLVRAFTAAFTVKGHEVVAAASIGIAVHSNGTDDPGTLLEHAGSALQRLKREGGGGCRVYEPENRAQHGLRLMLEGNLRRALENGEFNVVYQPKVNLRTGAITGAEALLRWTSPKLGAVSPVRFIPIAEETGLIVPIGAWVLETACIQAARWHNEGRPLEVAVNLSPRQFRDSELLRKVASALNVTALESQSVELEITEGTAMAHVESTISVLNELHRLGVKLAVDDFGTGYSSLAYLKRFPIDSLKIDRSFVLDIGSDESCEQIVLATIALAHSLRLKVVAEGIETPAQRDFLAAASCDEGQGYFYSWPLPATEFGALLGRRPPWLAAPAPEKIAVAA